VFAAALFSTFFLTVILPSERNGRASATLNARFYFRRRHPRALRTCGPAMPELL
jgi:hypothetical protein